LTLLAVIGIGDTIRSDSGEAIAMLDKLGCQVLITGEEDEATIRAIANEVGAGRQGISGVELQERYGDVLRGNVAAKRLKRIRKEVRSIDYIYQCSEGQLYLLTDILKKLNPEHELGYYSSNPRGLPIESKMDICFLHSAEPITG